MTPGEPVAKEDGCAQRRYSVLPCHESNTGSSALKDCTKLLRALFFNLLSFEKKNKEEAYEITSLSVYPTFFYYSTAHIK
jgi:hypothetical protein